jgi:uncharacterized protein with NRDE domain
MCLVLVALRSHPEYPLVVAANRDEFYDRATVPAQLWEEVPSVLAGRDLKAGGTWLGVDRRGRIAAVTNFRQGERENPAPRSRGLLVSEFLTGDAPAPEYMDRVQRDAALYNGFNLIAGDAGGLFYFSNRQGRVRHLAPGVYGLSNHLLDTPWPKVATTKTAFHAMLTGRGSELSEDLLRLLADRSQPADDLLPSTGVPPDWERLLSSAFIASDHYGTRSSTVVLVDRKGGVMFTERGFGPGGKPGEERRFQFPVAATADRGAPLRMKDDSGRLICSNLERLFRGSDCPIHISCGRAPAGY